MPSELDLWDAYIGVYRAAGKPLNDMDERKACLIWVGLSDADRYLAFAHITKIAAERPEHFIPMPVRHLQGREWERTAKPRTLPAPKSAKSAEFDRLFDEQFGGGNG